ncbi:hypothetical protein IFVP203_C1100194 [Vibrio parahaemolyticus]|uniref:Uncharacterized protein n=1 Tax=Vibrio parahaemolyticus TaxID=670 RepID=A0A5P4S6E2_VIBPH|nr:hypothetical protein [Vibrio parahaemolyticus]
MTLSNFMLEMCQPYLGQYIKLKKAHDIVGFLLFEINERF